MNLNCNTIIIGGGITGLVTAYNLLQKKEKNICILEKKYLGSGASTRNAGRYRVHFGNKTNLEYAIKAASYLKKLGKKLGYNMLLAPTGYLWLVYNEKTLKMFEEKNKLFRKYNVPLHKYQPQEIYKKYPFIKKQEKLKAGYLAPQNGSFHPDAYIYALEKRIRKNNGKIYEYTQAKEIIIKEKNFEITTNKGVLSGNKLVIAAGAWSSLLLRNIGINLKLSPIRKEILVTEPFQYLIEPFIVDEKRSLYFSQTLKGEIIGSCAIKNKEKGVNSQTNTIKWLVTYASRISSLLQAVEKISIIRVWSGFYNMTPDKSHIAGRCKNWPEQVYVITGFSGHGFMLGPLTGYLLAKYIATGKEPELLRPYSPCRFKEGRMIKETFIVG